MNANKIELLVEISKLKEKCCNNAYRHMTINDDIDEIQFELFRMKHNYKLQLIGKIKDLLKEVYFPINQDILDPDCEIEKIEEALEHLLDSKAHADKERRFYKLLFDFKNILTNTDTKMNENDLNKFCYGTQEYWNNISK